MLLSPLQLKAQTAQTPTRWPDFKSLFREFASTDSIVGASVVVLKDDRIIDRLDLGFADRDKRVPVDSGTIYHWGSITKGLTAISIMQLRDRGRLSLDDHVVDYIPELRQVHDPYGAIDSITIRMLMSHTAGFQNPTWPYTNGRDWEPFEPTRWEQLVSMMPYQEIAFKPGSRYSYSNPGFIYLARIIEQVTGDPWESYVQKNIFSPLGLSRSYFRATPYYLASHRSHNYAVIRDSSSNALKTIDRGADFDPGITVPNGGWNAPVSDIARYTAFLLNAKQDMLLKRSSLEEMWTPLTLPNGKSEMGLSFFSYGDVIGHTGHQAEFGAFFYFNPKTHYGVVGVYNTTNYDREVRAKDMEAKINQAAIDMLR